MWCRQRQKFSEAATGCATSMSAGASVLPGHPGAGAERAGRIVKVGIASPPLRGIPRRKAAGHRPLASLGRGRAWGGKRNAVQLTATLRALRDVDPLQYLQPLGGRLRWLVRHPRCADSQQATALRQPLPFDAVGQQAVVADAKEAVGQDVLEKAMEELHCGKFVNFLPIPVPAVSVRVPNLAVPAVQQAVIADRHAMRVATQVIDQFLWSGKRGFRVDHPEGRTGRKNGDTHFFEEERGHPFFWPGFAPGFR